MNKKILIPIIVIFVLGIGIFAWQYFVRPAPQEVEEEVKEEVVKKNLIVVKDKNNDFRLIDSKSAEYAVLRTGLKDRTILRHQIVEDKIFFTDTTEENVLKFIDLNNNIKELGFIKEPWNARISPDGQRIVWWDYKKEGGYLGNTIQLFVADIDGKNKGVLFEETFPEHWQEDALFWFFRILGWSEDSKKIYFTRIESNRGITLFGHDNIDLFVVDIERAQVSKIMEKRQIVFSDFLSEKNIISFVALGYEQKVIIYDWKNKKVIATIPISREYSAGNISFSPNGKYIIYTTIKEDAWYEDKYLSIFIADINGENVKKITDAGSLVGYSWFSDYEIILTDYHWGRGREGGVYIINKDGSGFRKISEYVFIGLMELTK